MEMGGLGGKRLQELKVKVAGSWVWIPKGRVEGVVEGEEQGAPRTTVSPGFGGLEINRGTSLAVAASEQLLVGVGAPLLRQPEETEEFCAALRTARDVADVPNQLRAAEIDWDWYDGGVGDGECPGSSGQMVEWGEDEAVELDYDDYKEELEEGEIPHWKDGATGGAGGGSLIVFH